MDTSNARDLRVTIVSAAGLYKSERFSSPDPFALIVINGERACRTNVVEKTVAPHWNESFIFKADNYRVLTIRVFDQKKFGKNNGQDFLGVMKFQIGSVIDLNIGGDKTITRELQVSKKSGGLVSHGRLTVVLSTNTYTQADRPFQNPIAAPPLFPQNRVETATVTDAVPISQETHVSRQMSAGEAPLTRHNTNDTHTTIHIDDGVVSNEGETSQNARLAWKRNFAVPQVQIQRDDPSPFTTIRRLGGGGIGIVYETKLDGISLALKHTYTRKLTPHHLNEFEILTRITERRHRHIVELIGSYVHKQPGSYELGLLIWPVARCDLAIFLQDIDSLDQWIPRQPSDSFDLRTENMDSTAIETLSAITGINQVFEDESRLAKIKFALHLRESSLHILQSRFGCIATAMAWLHQQSIRHKDLKPSQILLSSDGLWLTDFGWSKDISETARSTTSGGDNITFKYQSPERAQKEACGRPEDIFALGCIFLEMAYQLAKPTLFSDDSSAAWQQQGWYFQANLNQVQDLLKPLKQSMYESGHGFVLIKLIAEMLAKSPDDRPTVDEVVERLSSGNYFSKCCIPALGANPSGSNNDEHSQTGVTGLNWQHSLPPPDPRGSISSTHVEAKQASNKFLHAPNHSTNLSTYSQIRQQAANTQSHFWHHSTGAGPITETVRPDYFSESQNYPPHQQFSISQNPYNVGGAALPRTYSNIPPISTNATSNVPSPGSGYVSNYSPQDQAMYTAPRLPGQSLNQSFSNLTLSNHPSAQSLSSNVPNTGQTESWESHRESSFDPPRSSTETGGGKGMRQMKKALTGIDRQLNGLFNGDRNGRGLLSSGQTNLQGVAKSFQAKTNYQI